MQFMPLLIVCAVSGVLLLSVWRKLREARRADFIRGYAFPKGLIEKLQRQRPGLPAKDGQLVARALRQFFLAHLKSGRQFVAMPSQVTDELWHEFILYTRHYERFCRQAFGRFMHHTPAVVLAQAQRNNTGLRRTWWQLQGREHQPAQADAAAAAVRARREAGHRERLPLCARLQRAAGRRRWFGVLRRRLQQRLVRRRHRRVRRRGHVVQRWRLERRRQ